MTGSGCKNVRMCTEHSPRPQSSALIVYLCCAFLGISLHSYTGSWTEIPGHISSLLFISFPLKRVLGLSLEWTIARTIASLAGDGHGGEATKEEKTLSLGAGVLDVRTAGKRSGVCLSAAVCYHSVTGLPYSLAMSTAIPGSGIQSLQGKGNNRAGGWGGDNLEEATFSLAWLLAADELRRKLRSAVPTGTAIHSQIMPTSRFRHCKSFITATAGPVEPEGRADHLTICVTSQSGILLSGQKLWNCLGDPFQLNPSFPG